MVLIGRPYDAKSKTLILALDSWEGKENLQALLKNVMLLFNAQSSHPCPCGLHMDHIELFEEYKMIFE
jgi:hypothetical protein